MEYIWKPFVLVITSEIDDDLKVILSVSSPIILDTVSNHMGMSAFNKPGTDGIAFQEKIVILDAMLVFPKVASFGFERIPYFGISGTPDEVIEGIEEPFILTLKEIIHTFFKSEHVVRPGGFLFVHRCQRSLRSGPRFWGIRLRIKGWDLRA